MGGWFDLRIRRRRHVSLQRSAARKFSGCNNDGKQSSLQEREIEIQGGEKNSTITISHYGAMKNLTRHLIRQNNIRYVPRFDNIN